MYINARSMERKSSAAGEQRLRKTKVPGHVKPREPVEPSMVSDTCPIWHVGDSAIAGTRVANQTNHFVEFRGIKDLLLRHEHQSVDKKSADPSHCAPVETTWPRIIENLASRVCRPPPASPLPRPGSPSRHRSRHHRRQIRPAGTFHPFLR